jgi:2'-5' RNA ligase
MRLFVALALPEQARTDLVRAVDDVRRASGPLDGLRWAAPERWHLTLAFLGEVPDPKVPTVTSSIGRKVARHAALRLGVAGSGRFGRRVLWVGIAGDVPALGRLAAAVAAGARRAGVAVEDRPYRAHLTIARSEGLADLVPLAEALAAYTGPTWTAGEVLLVRSRLGPRPVHEPIAAWPLGRTGPAGD